MKHTFVLDENILYLGIRGIDEKGNPDTATQKLLLLIQKNCHKVIVDKELNRRYRKHLKRLEGISSHEPVIPGIENLIRNLLQNNDKVIWHFSHLGSAPDEETMPRKDIHVVRAGYHFQAAIVTVDEELAQALSSSVSLKNEGVTVLHPQEAIHMVEEP